MMSGEFNYEDIFLNNGPVPFKFTTYSGGASIKWTHITVKNAFADREFFLLYKRLSLPISGKKIIPLCKGEFYPLYQVTHSILTYKEGNHPRLFNSDKNFTFYFFLERSGKLWTCCCRDRVGGRGKYCFDVVYV